MKTVIRSSKLLPLSYWGLISAAILLMSGTCRKASNPVSKASDEISTQSFIGPWVANSVEVDIVSKNKTGGAEHLHYESKELAANQGRKPAITIYNGDGSYREEIYTLKDSLVQSKAGFWHYFEDSLFMRLDVSGSPKISFRAERSSNGLQLLSRIDWDGDEAKDDQMTVLLRRP
jgi:hypothetical protein